MMMNLTDQDKEDIYLFVSYYRANLRNPENFNWTAVTEMYNNKMYYCEPLHYQDVYDAWRQVHKVALREMQELLDG